ncbi:hypothetical protein [Acetobacter sp. A11-2]|uniref:hypothetical protein n=1 Tax=Acetobacter sp. A11-2 TaxID=3157859 RepID=UPI0032EC380B
MSDQELILFRLTPDEATALTAQKGQGGFQSLFAKRLAQFDSTRNEVRLTDEGLGMIVRHLSYGPGGFQLYLKKIFGRSLMDLLNGIRER